MKYFAAFLVIVLFVSGCGTTNKNTDPSELIKEIYKGTDGLVMSFMKGAPPDEVYEESPFPINIELENKGAYDIKDGKGIISIGLENDYMEVSGWLDNKLIRAAGDSKAQFDLQGKSQANPKGDKTIASLVVDALRIKEEMSEKHESLIMATACYKYQTKVIETICIDTDVHNLLSKEKVCEVKDITLSDQGAPIAVVKIEESMQPEKYGSQLKPEFIISIENKGKGQAIKDGTDIIEKACSAEPLTNDELNVIGVSAFLPGQGDTVKQLNCDITKKNEGENKAYIKLNENKGSARCVLEEGISTEEGTFLSPLTIILDYGYTSTISKSVTITRVVGY